MLKTKEFIGTINVPQVQDEVNSFIKELTSDQIIDLKYNTNVVNIRKTDGSTSMIILSSALLVYEAN